MPDVSVVIPTFNRAHMLGAAIESCLNQRDVDLEVVVCDNASADNTREVVAAYAGDRRLRYIRHPSNIGMIENWRSGIFEHARAEHFVLLSDDDYFTDLDYLGAAARAIVRHSPRFVYAGGVVEDSQTGATETLRLPFEGVTAGAEVFASRGTLKPYDILFCNLVLPRQDAARLGFLRNPSNLSADSELYLKLCCEGSVFAVPAPVCVYRKHGTNVTHKIVRSPAFLQANLEHLVEPLLYAQARGMDAASIQRYVSNSRITQAISSALLRLMLHSRQAYEACRSDLAGKVPDLLARAESGPAHRAKKAIVRLAPGLLRKKYSMEAH